MRTLASVAAPGPHSSRAASAPGERQPLGGHQQHRQQAGLGVAKPATLVGPHHQQQAHLQEDHQDPQQRIGHLLGSLGNHRRCGGRTSMDGR